MSHKSLFAGTILALAIGSAAYAQTAAPPADAATAPPAADTAPPAAAAAAPMPATAADFKAGDVVKDNGGAVVGTVVKAGAAADGQLAVLVNIDGKDIPLPGKLFMVAQGAVTVQASKAQIEAAMAKG